MIRPALDLTRCAWTQRHGDIGDPGIAQIEHMRVALRTITDDGNLLGFEDVEIGIPIVIDAHGKSP
jgi:hypothetical protein